MPPTVDQTADMAAKARAHGKCGDDFPLTANHPARPTSACGWPCQRRLSLMSHSVPHNGRRWPRPNISHTAALWLATSSLNLRVASQRQGRIQPQNPTHYLPTTAPQLPKSSLRHHASPDTPSATRASPHRQSTRPSPDKLHGAAGQYRRQEAFQ